MDPITDIFKTMHVTAFGQHRLEATAPWGLTGGEQAEELLPGGRTILPANLAHFAMLSRGSCWLSVSGTTTPIPLTGGDCFLLARGTSFALLDSPQTRPKGTFREIASRMPKWIVLPLGMKRDDVRLSMDYYTIPWGPP